MLQSFADVTITEDGVNTVEFLEASEGLVKMFGSGIFLLRASHFRAWVFEAVDGVGRGLLESRVSSTGAGDFSADCEASRRVKRTIIMSASDPPFTKGEVDAEGGH